MSNYKYTAWFDRSATTIDAFFTLQRQDLATGKVEKVFDRIPASSGQRGYTHLNWTSGKAPIPFTSQIGHPYRLWTSVKNRGLRAGARGIGSSFPVSTGAEKALIVGLPSLGFMAKRFYIELHGDNAIPGSAGCPVIKRVKHWEAIEAYLCGLAKQGIEYIDFTVL
jgi:hypothetical protein